MDHRSQGNKDSREFMLRLLPVSALLAGLSDATVMLFQPGGKSARLVPFADDLLVICAVLFSVSTYLIFWALRSHNVQRTRQLARLVEYFFLIALTALTALVCVGFLLIYAFF
jgi:hypothetical protein